MLLSYAVLSAAWLAALRNDFRPSPPAEASLDLQWVSSLEDVGQEAWGVCFPREDVLKSFALHRAVEAARLPGIEFHHLLARREGRVLAIVPCFRIRLSLTTVAPDIVKKAVDTVRRLFPGFLCARAFIVGTPVAICRDLLGVQQGRDGPLPAEVLRAVTREVLDRARRLRMGWVIIKELTSRFLPQVREVLSESFTLVESAATTWLYLGEEGAGTYRERLRKKYRSMMTHRERQLVDSGMRWELHHDFAPYAERMEALYLQVLHRSKVQFETLNRDFFVELSRRLGKRAFALLCFQEDELVAFELFLEDAGEVHPVYLGMDYRHRDQGALYFNCIYKIVEQAEARGKAVVELGQTSYAAKASLGAVVDRLYLAVRHLNPAVNLLLRVFRRALFPPTQVPRRQRVFRDMRANDEALVRHGVHFEEALS
ncbi:GNAT family N-acetyltransferase [Pyxidicoccus parkwayensis]|uniref:GNAT family N-acetyltransferase n=2 Tax=Pyxidicoccus parkwayensis TaxID=2813578 RepID=A0ABX7PBS0_9BACT|nr:GNAT family N-acetyltransferase [Pyxidicoccus parkwaysis]